MHVTDSETPPRLVGGRYRLGERLGTGAMGVVWSAYDELLQRSVAVKEVQLPAGMPEAEADAARERTLREARAVAALNHANVITVYDVVATGQVPYVVMELVTGRSLAAVTRGSGPLDEHAAALVADAVAAALLTAHRHGITHRDVKPGNVLVGDAGQVRLTDFGIARSVAESTMTHTGIVLGSPAYIAPELAEGAKAAPAADQWSLGATLFAAVTGRPPYEPDGGIVATLHEVVDGEVPDPGVHGPIGEVIRGLMVKDPQRRMDLLEVRRAVYSLLPAPGESLFDLSGAEQEPPPPAPPHPQHEAVPAPPSPPEPETSEPAPLAGEPGPLPFTPPTARPRSHHRRGRVLTVGLVAVLLFVLAGTGTFVAARTIAGKRVLPQQAVVTADTPAHPIGPLVRQEGRARTLNGARGGGFSLMVPQGWRTFIEQRTARRLPAAAVVHFVSTDGKQEITVERVPQFFPRFTVRDYWRSVRESWPAGDLSIQQSKSDEKSEFMYRTVESGGGAPGTNSHGDVGRTKYAKTIKDDSILWVVTAAVPTDQEDKGYTRLYERIAPTFRPED